LIIRIIAHAKRGPVIDPFHAVAQPASQGHSHQSQFLVGSHQQPVFNYSD
jgi:hypothetical protein